MPPLRSALLDWDPNRVTRVAVSVVAVFVALRLTDDFVPGVGVAVVLAAVLDVPWWLSDRYGSRTH